MNKITEALKKMLPAEHLKEVETAVSEMVAEAKAELEKEFNAKLQEAYEQVSEELEAAEATAYQGYEQAFEIIESYKVRLEQQSDEHENQMEEGYSEAWELLKAEQNKNEKLELELYEEFNKKLAQMKEFFVEKIDQYLNMQNSEIYEHARRDIMNDPRMVEHKVALDKIVDIAASYFSEEEFTGTTINKLEETQKMAKDLKEQVHILEARNVRLSTQNNKLNEQVREMNGVITESAKTERKERAKVAGTASGRGQRVLGEQVIPEFKTPGTKETNDQNLIENNEVMNDLLVLSGITINK